MDSAKLPSVSVVIPAFNCQAYVQEAVESVLEQQYTNLEIIVVDDGSTDCTVRRLAAYGDSVKLISQRNSGQSVARNRGVMASQGELIAFLDADDVWAPGKLEKQVALMQANHGVVLVYSDFCRTKHPRRESISRLASLRARSPGRAFQDLLRENFIHTSSVLVRKAAFAEAGLFDPTLRGPEDQELWVRLARVGDFACVEQVLVWYRMHDANTISTLRFARHLPRAFHLILDRWPDDPDVVAGIGSALGESYWDLAYREWLEGNLAEARRAYWNCSRIGYRVFGGTARALICCAPAVLLTPLWRLRTAGRPASGQTADPQLSRMPPRAG